MQIKFDRRFYLIPLLHNSDKEIMVLIFSESMFALPGLSPAPLTNFRLLIPVSMSRDFLSDIFALKGDLMKIYEGHWVTHKKFGKFNLFLDKNSFEATRHQYKMYLFYFFGIQNCNMLFD